MKRLTMIIILIIALSLSACKKEESDTSSKMDSKNFKARSVKNKENSTANTKAYLKALIDSDAIYCGHDYKDGPRLPKAYREAWSQDKGPTPHKFVYYQGKNTPELSDDIVHSSETYYYSNSREKVREGKEPPSFVPITRHIVFNNTGRYQWIENAAQTLADIKTMPSIQQGWSMRHVEEHLEPSFVDRDRLLGYMKDEERGTFLYAFDVWTENMREYDYPTEKLKGCVVPAKRMSVTPPDLDYISYETVFENYKDSSDPIEVSKNVAAMDFRTYLDPLVFPEYVLYGSRPRYKSK